MNKIGVFFLAFLLTLSAFAKSDTRQFVSLKFQGADATSLYQRLHRDGGMEGALYSAVSFPMAGGALLKCIRKMGRTTCYASAPQTAPDAAVWAVTGQLADRLSHWVGAYFSTGDGRLRISCGNGPVQGSSQCELNLSPR